MTTRRRARAAAWVTLAAFAVVGGAACRDVVAGSADDLVSDLCATLEACTGTCPDSVLYVDPDVSDDVWDGLLKYDLRFDCASSCSGAKKCLDHAPFCSEAHDGCTSDAACCSYTLGLSRCDGADEGQPGACCDAAGAPCDVGGPNGDTCCAEAPCAANGRCGGLACTLTREEVGDDASACETSFDCCSHRCEAGHCVAFSCAPLTGSCKVDSDCCGQSSSTGPAVQPVCDPALHVCVDPTPDVCDVCEPVQDPTLNCCLANDQRCYVLVDGTSTCGSSSCSPLGGDCSGDGDCCAVDSPTEGVVPGYCDYVGTPHCGLRSQTCGGLGSTCADDAACCSGHCAAGFCAASDNCVPPECHDPCVLGAPIDPLVCSGTDATRISTVCAAQPACCCQAWTATCRAKYEQLAGSACM